MGNWMATKGGRSTYLVGKGGGPTRLKVQPGHPMTDQELRLVFREDVTLMTQAMQLVDPDGRRCQGGTRNGGRCSEFRGLFHTLRGPALLPAPG